MMSIQMTLYKNKLKVSGLRKWTKKSPEELKEKIEKWNEKNAYALPEANFDHLFSEVEISLVIHNQLITFKVIRMIQKTPSEKAILYCPGNVLPLLPEKADLAAAWEMGDETARDVWLPYYPINDTITIDEQVACLYEVYKEMLKYYDAKSVDFFGYSLGASMMIDFFPFNNAHEKLDTPRYLFLVSPIGNAVGKEQHEMRRLSRKDPLMTYEFGSDLLKGSDDFIHFRHLNLSGCPETWLYYGDADIYSVKAKSIISSFKMDLITIHSHLEKEAPHAYCKVPSFKEAKESYEEIISHMKEPLTTAKKIDG